MKKIIFIATGLLFVIACILIFRPVPIVEEKNAIVVEGIVADIIDTADKDVFFKLKDDNRRFYVNSGVECGLDVEDLKSRLIGNSIILKYPEYWTPLDWNNRIRHISKVEFGSEVIYNELR